MNQEIMQALDRRDPQAIAELLASHGHTDNQQNALLDVMFDHCTVGEIKRVRAWAENWLVEPAHDVLRVTHDMRWQAMVTVYAMAGLLIKQSGVALYANGNQA